MSSHEKKRVNILRKRFFQLQLCANFEQSGLFVWVLIRCVNWISETFLHVERSKWESFSLLYQQNVGFLFQFDEKINDKRKFVHLLFSLKALHIRAKCKCVSSLFIFVSSQKSASFVYLLSRIWQLRFYDFSVSYRR